MKKLGKVFVIFLDCLFIALIIWYRIKDRYVPVPEGWNQKYEIDFENINVSCYIPDDFKVCSDERQVSGISDTSYIFFSENVMSTPIKSIDDIANVEYFDSYGQKFLFEHNKCFYYLYKDKVYSDSEFNHNTYVLTVFVPNAKSYLAVTFNSVVEDVNGKEMWLDKSNILNKDNIKAFAKNLKVKRNLG